MKKRPIGIDLFSGAGGMSLGFEQAGFEIAAAVEIDPIHAATHHFNFPNCKVIARSVIGLTGDEIRSVAGIGKKPIDVVFGGPPCQGFSLIGQRMLDDNRNQLVKEFVRLVSELGARYFVFENVKGLTIGKHKVFLESLVQEFEDKGYKVRTPWRVLNAKNYRVPQDRQRLFLFGAKKGYQLPAYPEAITFHGSDIFAGKGKLPAPTCADALGDLPDSDRFRDLMASDEVSLSDWSPIGDYSREMHCIDGNGWHFGYRRNWKSEILTSSMRTVHTEISRKRFASTPEGEIEPISRFFKLSRRGICNTLRAGTDSARGAFTSPRPIHFAFPRCITVREMARLHGFPDWFRFHVTKWHGARQVGNSVPPPLARSVAGSVIAALGHAPILIDTVLKPESPRLLSMDMSEAAEFWNVPVLIGRRDRKNGLHKRSQIEIQDSFLEKAAIYK